MKRRISILLLSAFSVSLFAETPNNVDQVFDQKKYSKSNPITTAVPCLIIAPDARGGGMGDIGAASSADVNSQYWNPAKYPQINSDGGVSFSYTPWLKNLVGDINLFNVTGFYQFAPRKVLSASLKYFSLGDVTYQTSQDDPGVNVRPNEFAIDLAYSMLFSETWSGSVALRYIHSDLGAGVSEELSAGNAVGADIAFYYLQPLRVGAGSDFSLGIDISNIGSKISYDKGNTKQFLPTNFRLGAGFAYKIDDYNSVTFLGEINKLLVPTQNNMSDDDYSHLSSISGIFRSFSDAPGGFKEELKEVTWSLGAEYSYQGQFFARAGYFHESEDKGNRRYFTFGAGFKLYVFELHAAYVMAQGSKGSNPLDKTLRFTLGFDIGSIKQMVSNRANK